MVLNQLEESIKEWASLQVDLIDEIFVIGSQAKSRDENNHITSDSDYDILITLKKDYCPDSIYSELSILGLKHGILIHPLIINKNEVNLKLNIPQYRSVKEKGKLIFKQ